MQTKPKRRRVGYIHFGCPPWEAQAERQPEGRCDRCHKALPKTGRHYCAACASLPGGELAAAMDDASAPSGGYHAAPDSHVKIRVGIEVPARFARLATI